MRLPIEDLRLSGSNVQIRLRISLDPLDRGTTGARPTHKPTPVPAQRPAKTACVPSVVTDGQSYASCKQPPERSDPLPN
jgi:hypothetical protein